MPYPVKQLFANLNEPVVALPDEPLSAALNRMLQHDYSQLPVTKGEGQAALFFLITTDTILQTLSSFGLTTVNTQLRVSDSLKKVSKVYSEEDEIFDLMSGIATDGVALVVNENRHLSHVVTSHDTTIYFRQWAEDIMHAREVEDCLKKYINATFRQADGTIDEASQRKAIDDITSTNRDLRRKFDRAIARYINNSGGIITEINPQVANESFLALLTPAEDEVRNTTNPDSPSTDSGDQLLRSSGLLHHRFHIALAKCLSLSAGATPIVNTNLAEDAFLEIYNPRERPTQFRDLTLDHLIKLFCQDSCWSRYAAILRLEKEAVRFMLEGVRDTRNNLAHFREEEITTEDRIQLRRCAEWLVSMEKEALSIQ
jgi:CBS domain-containing protein